MMYQVLDKDTIRIDILPHLSVAKRGFRTSSCLIEVINSILYKLKYLLYIIMKEELLIVEFFFIFASIIIL